MTLLALDMTALASNRPLPDLGTGGDGGPLDALLSAAHSAKPSVSGAALRELDALTGGRHQTNELLGERPAQLAQAATGTMSDAPLPGLSPGARSALGRAGAAGAMAATLDGIHSAVERRAVADVIGRYGLDANKPADVLAARLCLHEPDHPHAARLTRSVFRSRQHPCGRGGHAL